jgi:inorganic pyrophosphatase
MIASSPFPRIRTASGSCKAFEDLPPEVKEELEKFFVATDELEAKTLKFLGWQGPAQAKKLVRRCEKVFKKKK